MQSFDVIIIGAGPAGLQCAEALGNTHLSVLLLEKNEVIGPKICAGGLTGKDIAYLNLPEELLEFGFNRVRLHVNNLASTIKSEENFAFTIDRERFGQWQFNKLKTFPNIEVRTHARVSEITRESVTANKERIGYRYLVGADGSNSIVKQFLGIRSGKRNIGLQYIIPTDKYTEFEIFFQPKYFSAWYAWIFPHRGYVSIGCGADLEHLSLQKLKKNFHRWLKERCINVAGGKFEAFPMDADYHELQFGNVFLAGDAAGLLSYFTGEGIYQALISGETAAKLILNPNHISGKMTAVLHKHTRHHQLMEMLLRAGIFKSLLFTAGLFLFKIPTYEKKAIAFFG